MDNELIEVYKSAALYHEAQAEKYAAKIAELAGTEPKKRGRPAGSKNKSDEPEKEGSV